eukprot:1303561-Pleurochrysis_carterae.AAC.1
MRAQLGWGCGCARVGRGFEGWKWKVGKASMMVRVRERQRSRGAGKELPYSLPSFYSCTKLPLRCPLCASSRTMAAANGVPPSLFPPLRLGSSAAAIQAPLSRQASAEPSHAESRLLF